VQPPEVNIPSDDQFFSTTEKDNPDIEFLKHHFYREGRIKEEHALYIIEKATQLLRAEPNVLTIDPPVTGTNIASYTCRPPLTDPCSLW
jgi:serine/threonine-protein phosphatase 2B catalytic subunit